jgi:hypothetical protein
MPYFDGQLFHGAPGNPNSWDVRFDPSDAAHLSTDSEGRLRFRIVTEPSSRRATVVTDFADRLATVLQMTLPGSADPYHGDEVGMTGREEPGS